MGLTLTTTAHFYQYFKIEPDPETGEPEYTFDWGALKNVHKSFLDSIVVELCLPSSPIPKQVLYQLLGEAIEESPKDRQKFSQAVWDAVGDLSVSGDTFSVHSLYAVLNNAHRLSSSCRRCSRVC